MNVNGTAETHKEIQYSVSSLLKKFEDKYVMDDYPNQRGTGNWSSDIKSNLISDILQNNPIPAMIFVEQVTSDGNVKIWVIDGKHRLDSMDEFKNDGFKISNKVRRFMIPYKRVQRDANGRVMVDKNGMRMLQELEFDIRGKKFSQLPEELKDKFNDYDIHITYYFNISSSDIQYHIERYNDGKPMNHAQKGMTRLNEDQARIVRSIENADFFNEVGEYRKKDFHNGVLDKVIYDTIAIMKFPELYTNRAETTCEKLNLKSIDSFYEVEELFNDLGEMFETESDKKVGEIFNNTSTVYLATVFDRFCQLKKNIDNHRFVDFLAYFEKNAPMMTFNDMSYEDLFVNPRHPRDKKLLLTKIEEITKMMCEYFDCKNEWIESDESEIEEETTVKETQTEESNAEEPKTENNTVESKSEDIVTESENNSIKEEEEQEEEKEIQSETIETVEEPIVEPLNESAQDDDIDKELNEENIKTENTRTVDKIDKEVEEMNVPDDEDEDSEPMKQYDDDDDDIDLDAFFEEEKVS